MYESLKVLHMKALGGNAVLKKQCLGDEKGETHAGPILVIKSGPNVCE